GRVATPRHGARAPQRRDQAVAVQVPRPRPAWRPRHALLELTYVSGKSFNSHPFPRGFGDASEVDIVGKQRHRGPFGPLDRSGTPGGIVAAAWAGRAPVNPTRQPDKPPRAITEATMNRKQPPEDRRYDVLSEMLTQRGTEIRNKLRSLREVLP